MGWWGYLYPAVAARPVRPVGSAAARCTASIDGGASFFDSKSLLRCRHVDEDPVHGFGGSAKPGRWPVLRKPPKPHAREDSRLHAVALDAVPASAF